MAKDSKRQQRNRQRSTYGLRTTGQGRRRRLQGSGGCGYLFLVAISAGTLLLINGSVIFAVFQWYAPEDTIFTSDIRFSQIVLIIGPVVMILAEYWLYDVIVDRMAILDDASD